MAQVILIVVYIDFSFQEIRELKEELKEMKNKMEKGIVKVNSAFFFVLFLMVVVIFNFFSQEIAELEGKKRTEEDMQKSELTDLQLFVMEKVETD